MENIEEQAQKIINSSINLIDECEKNLELQKIKYNKLKKQIIELEGALIRAGLPIKKIKYKSKNQLDKDYWRIW